MRPHPALLHAIYALYARVVRVSIDPLPVARPVAYVFWHSGLFMLPHIDRGRGTAVLISTHADGELVATLAARLGFAVVRGSSTRQGVIGALGLARAVARGASVAVTPDGPRGPRWRFKSSTLALLAGLKAPVVFAGIGYSPSVALKSWDRFRLPLPGAHCRVILERVSLSDTDVEEATSRLTELTLRAEAEA